jgi:uncharacterized protein YbaR (Trm112 family)
MAGLAGTTGPRWLLLCSKALRSTPLRTEELLDLLACPKCHAKLRAVEAQDPGKGVAQGLLCEPCKLLYALEDGLPNMLISEARTWPLPAAEGTPPSA